MVIQRRSKQMWFSSQQVLTPRLELVITIEESPRHSIGCQSTGGIELLALRQQLTSISTQDDDHSMRGLA